jgi:hypothetical protein
MLRSFLGRKWVLASLAVATTLAFSAVVVPALGGPSLKQLVKKEVKRQLKGKVGPQGPPGPPGANGATSPSAASFVGDTTSTAIGTSDTDLFSTQITLANDSLVEANAMVNIGVITNPRVVNCYIKLDGTDITTRSSDTITNGDLATVPVVGAQNNVAAGTHTVKVGCVETTGTGSATYNSGNLNVIAVG